MKEAILKTNRMLQVAFIVSDVQKAAEKYANLFGIEVPPVTVSGTYEEAQTVYL